MVMLVKKRRENRYAMMDYRHLAIRATIHVALLVSTTKESSMSPSLQKKRDSVETVSRS
jgi:hypothetical protein